MACHPFGAKPLHERIVMYYSWNHLEQNKGNHNRCHGPLARYEYCGLRMRRECRERFSRHRLQRKPQVSDPDMHHGTCVTHVPWCMSGSLTSGGGENVPGIPGACATCNFTYLVRGPLTERWRSPSTDTPELIFVLRYWPSVMRIQHRHHVESLLFKA